MTEVLLLVVSLALVVACGAFVAAEFSFVTVDRSTVDRAAEAGDRRARGVRSALRSLSTQLSGAQLGITLTNLLIGFLAEPTIADLIKGPLEDLGVPSGAVTGIGYLIALLVATTFTMVLGELVPKNLAIARPLQTAKAVQGFMRGFTRINRPLIAVFNGAANAILRRFDIEPQEELASARSPEELASLIGRSASEGTLERDTATLLQRSLGFAQRDAVDVMTPRTRMRSVRADDSVATIIEAARATGFSRFPVVGASADEIVGIAHVKRAVGVPVPQRADTPVRDVMVDPLFVPATVELDPLLRQLRQTGLQMAIVVDEFGGVDGLVTLEDVIEEIVGEVLDEHDRRDPAVHAQAGGSWLVFGLLCADEIATTVGVELPESEDYETLGGLIADRLGRFAHVGDEVDVAARDRGGDPVAVRLRVARMDGLRVDRVRLALVPEASA